VSDGGLSPDDVQAYLEEQSPPEASLRQIAMGCSAQRDAVRHTVEQMREWGVVETRAVDHGTVWRLVDGGEIPDDASDMPCPLGCGYRPTTGRGAFVHLVAHTIGRNSTGRDQQTAAE